MCQKSLSEYSVGSDSTSIRPHLLSITTNEAALTFDATGPEGTAVTVTSVGSAEGVQVLFSEPVTTGARIVGWLTALLGEMQRTMKDAMRSMVSDIPAYLHKAGPGSFGALVTRYPEHVALMGIQIMWTVS